VGAENGGGELKLRTKQNRGGLGRYLRGGVEEDEPGGDREERQEELTGDRKDESG
jgi:hypothetical protein